jgi:DNA (cytosine-5)-methyltransferase 1
VAIPPLRVLGLCAGIGGLELGIARAAGAARTVCYVEREAFAAACLVARMAAGELGEAPVWSDLATFDGRPWRGRVDCVAAGFPCQPWSAAGKRQGTADERWIWPDIARVIREVGPSLVVLENVPGLLAGGLGHVLGDLASLGFDAEWGLFRASDVGAPHRRERLFVLGWRDGECLRQLVGHAYGLDGEGRGGAGLAGQARPAPRRAGVADVGAPHRRERLFVVAWQVPDAGRECLRQLAERQQPRPSERWDAEPRDVGEDLADSWPPGPSDTDGWRQWLDAGGPAPTQPRVRRGVDGLLLRVDPDRARRLRALGNAVVPAQAAQAIRILAGRALT